MCLFHIHSAYRNVVHFRDGSIHHADPGLIDCMNSEGDCP